MWKKESLHSRKLTSAGDGLRTAFWMAGFLSMSCAAPSPVDDTNARAESPGRVVRPLVLGEALPAVPDEVYVYEIYVAERHSVRLRVEQQGADVIIRHFEPSGRLHSRLDGPGGNKGVEDYWDVGKESGIHRLEVSTPGQSEGLFTAHLDPSNRINAAERRLIEADRKLRQIEARFLDPNADIIDSASHVDALKRALEILTEAGLHERQARATGLLCLSLSYTDAVPAKEIIDVCHRAARLFRRLGDPLQEAVYLTRLAEAQQDGGLPRSAAIHLDRAASIFRTLSRDRELANTARMLADAHFQLGELKAAWDWIDQAVQLRPHLETRLQATLGISYGDLLLAMNRPEEASKQYQEAERLYRQLDDVIGAAIGLERQARTERRLGRPASSIERCSEGLALLPEGSESVLYKHWRRPTAALRLQMGRAYIELGKPSEARNELGRALALAEELNAAQLQAKTQLYLADLDIRTLAPKKALGRIDEARGLFQQIDQSIGLLLTRFHGARALRALGRNQEAWVHLAPTLPEVDRRRGSSPSSDLQIAYFAYRQEIYDLAVELLLEQRAQRPAATHQASALHDFRSSRHLLDGLTIAQRDPQGDPQIRAVKRRLLQSVEEGSRAELGELLKELLRGDSGRPDPYLSPMPSVETLAEQHSELLSGLVGQEPVLLLQYFIGASRAWLLAFWDGELRAFDLGPAQTVDRAARDFESAVATVSGRRQGRRARFSERLGRHILPLELPEHIRRWVVIPSGRLHRIPFAALQSPTSGDLLIRRQELVTLPSLRVWRALRASSDEGLCEGPDDDGPSSNGRIVLFADPVFSSNDKRAEGPSAEGPKPEDFETQTHLRRAMGRFGLGSLPRLSYSREEAEAVVRVAGTRPVQTSLGFDASRERFFATSFAKTQILHLATHAFEDSEYPELSGVVLSRFDERGQGRVGYLPAFEIAASDLPVELVVLSACRTGAGPTIAGEGVLSLNRSFFAAGARRVISSLWSVDDRSTARLMTDFYRFHLQEGLPASGALRRAQLERLNHSETAEPFHWAGFIFNGDWLPSPCAARATKE